MNRNERQEPILNAKATRENLRLRKIKSSLKPLKQKLSPWYCALLKYL